MTSKTEKPTEKKKETASKEGQVWKSADVSSFALLGGMAWILGHWVSLAPSMAEMLALAEEGFVGNDSEMIGLVLQPAVHILALVFACAIGLSVLPSLLMSRFTLGTKVVKFDFAAISPVAGFKRIFNRRNLKDSVKACLYFVLFIVAAGHFWRNHRIEILTMASMTPASAVLHLLSLLISLAYELMLVTLILSLADMLLSYLLYLRDLKMTRSEVKQEHKDLQGSAEIKQERRRLSHQMLSSDMKTDIEQSSMVVANPTHIAVALYLNPAVCPLPFISVMESDARALAVIAHARKMNIPVVRHIPLARKLFKQYKRYSFVADDSLSDITEILQWMMDVDEVRRQHLMLDDGPAPDAGAEPGAA
jgi:flagellar biosynthesis protein FlhB